MKRAYMLLLILSVALTACLFYMEYMYWDNDGTLPSASTIAVEFLFVGSMYTALIWGVLSGLYFLVNRVLQLISK